LSFLKNGPYEYYETAFMVKYALNVTLQLYDDYANWQKSNERFRIMQINNAYLDLYRLYYE